MKYKQTAGNVIFNILNHSFFIVFALLCFFPFYYILINTISANDLVATGRVLLYPKGVHFDNFGRVLSLPGLWQATLVTLARTFIGTFLSIICTGFLAFAFTRQELWRRKLWYRFFIVTMFFSAGLIPWFMTMRLLGLTNNFLAYIIGVISVFNMILFKTYIESIPNSLAESAEVDGAGYLTVFFKILFPICKPIVATLTIFTAVGHWNSFMDTLWLMTNEKLFTLQFILYRFLNEATRVAQMIRDAESMGLTVAPSHFEMTPTSVRMTITVVVVMPIMCLYPFFQRFFIKGIMIGAIKG